MDRKYIQALIKFLWVPFGLFLIFLPQIRLGLNPSTSLIPENPISISLWAFAFIMIVIVFGIYYVIPTWFYIKIIDSKKIKNVFSYAPGLLSFTFIFVITQLATPLLFPLSSHLLFAKTGIISAIIGIPVLNALFFFGIKKEDKDKLDLFGMNSLLGFSTVGLTIMTILAVTEIFNSNQYISAIVAYCLVLAITLTTCFISFLNSKKHLYSLVLAVGFIAYAIFSRGFTYLPNIPLESFRQRGFATLEILNSNKSLLPLDSFYGKSKPGSSYRFHTPDLYVHGYTTQYFFVSFDKEGNLEKINRKIVENIIWQ